ncbi:hypothetical protein Tco_0161778 [Tanacetum coccineum]
MQDEIHEFDRLQVWELVPQPDCVMIIALKWIYKVKLDDSRVLLKNRLELVARDIRQEEGSAGHQRNKRALQSQQQRLNTLPLSRCCVSKLSAANTMADMNMPANDVLAEQDGREIFGMPILDALLTDAIKSASYYNSYLEHVTEYQRYLNEEHDKADDKSPEPALSQPPTPTPTPTDPPRGPSSTNYNALPVLTMLTLLPIELNKYGSSYKSQQKALKLISPAKGGGEDEDWATNATQVVSKGADQVAMSPPIRRKYRDSVAFATGCRRIKKCKRCNHKIRIPIGMWPCRVEEKMTLKEVNWKTVEEIETKIIAKDGTITRVPGEFQGYETSEEEPVEQPRRHDLYGFVDHPQLQQGNPMNEFTQH